MSTPNDPPNPYGGNPEEPQQPGVPQDPSAPQYPSPYGTPPPPPPTAPPAPQYGSPQYGAAPQYGGAPYAPQYGAPVGAPPNNYLVWSILTTVFCCIALGIPSIVFASQVNSKWAQGDVAGAQASSVKARQFAMWSAIVGGILIAAYVGLVVIGSLASSNSGY
ncbi:CD225/dispanin family protein [Cellulomonas sp. URHD0024]|uniref:CD225/dispanin family protein n=1 Tax=Cellulomonas sp. URHD0024 TaxID=1302620 RepID=UPI0003FF5FDD|nr:CD225/dispanin family protein [Cellulomonas sp. URHD0024]